MRTYPVAQAVLACLLVILLPAAAPARDILVSPLQADNPLAQFCLQGLANRAKEGPLVYVSNDVESDPWLAAYRAGNKISALQATAVGDRVKAAAKGQVLYDPGRPYTVNVATSVAGVMDGVATDRDLGLPTLFDARTRFADAAAAYRWAIATILPTCSKRELALLPPDHAEFRDYAVKNRLFVFDPGSSDPEVAGLLAEVLRRMPEGITVYTTASRKVWEPLVPVLSSAGAFLVPISAAQIGDRTGGANFSFHSAFKATAPLRQALQFHPLGNRLVTFIYTGGEDIGVDMGLYRRMWADPARGASPVGWTISPALSDLAPVVLQYYYSRAQLAGNDEFVMAPSGTGLLYPSAAPGLADLLTTEVATASGLSVGVVVDRGDAQAQTAAAQAYLTEAGLQGVVVTENSPVESQLLAGKPIIRATMAANNSPGALLAAIRKNSASLIVVLVNPERFTPSMLAAVTSRMTSDIYTIVPPSQFMDGVRAAVATRTAAKPAAGRAQISGLALTPAEPALGQPFRVQADIVSPDGAALVQVVYGLPGRTSYVVTMTGMPTGTYQAEVPPLYWAGDWAFQVRVVDNKGGVTTSSPVTAVITGQDRDRDGLADPFEAYLRTDPDNRDSDGDGLLDGNDEHFLTPDQPVLHFVHPLTPPGDGPYLESAGGSQVSRGIRQIPAGETVSWRLPLSTLPPGAPAAIQLVASGPYTAAISYDGQTFQPALPEGEAYPDGLLVIPIAGGSTRSAQVWLQVTAGRRQVAVRELSVTTPPGGPHFASLGTAPAYPAPGLEAMGQAQIFHPAGIAQVLLHYRVDGGEEQIAPALPDPGGSQVFQAPFARLQNGSVVSWWLEATAGGEPATRAVTPVQLFRMGTARAEAITLLGGRDFMGAFLPGSEWSGNYRWSSVAAEDTARFTPTGGGYAVWVLAAPRGSALQVLLDGRRVGTINATAPDGWQKVGTVMLDDREHAISVQTPGGGSPAGYAEVLLTTDSRLALPAPVTLDIYNSVSALYPAPGQVLSGVVDVRATATGNVDRVQLAVDGVAQRAGGAPPYLFRWFTRQVADGPHTLELQGFDRLGNLMLSVQVPVIVANRASR